MLLHQVNAIEQYHRILGEHARDGATLAFIFPRDYDYFVSFFEFHILCILCLEQLHDLRCERTNPLIPTINDLTRNGPEYAIRLRLFRLLAGACDEHDGILIEAYV